jgi:hypothetical protein
MMLKHHHTDEELANAVATDVSMVQKRVSLRVQPNLIERGSA